MTMKTDAMILWEGCWFGKKREGRGRIERTTESSVHRFARYLISVYEEEQEAEDDATILALSYCQPCLLNVRLSLRR